MPETLELNVGGQKVEAFVQVLGKSRADSSMIRESFFGKDSEFLVKSSNQPDVAANYTTLVTGANCELPPVPLDKLRELYRKSAVHAACCDAKVSYVAGQGYRVRPRAELFPRMDDWKPNRSNKGPDTSKQNTILDFLEIPGDSGTSFQSILQKMWLDVEVLGQGYIELTRGGDSRIDGMYDIKGETVLISKGGIKNGFWQKRGIEVQFYAPYDGSSRHKIANISKSSVLIGEESRPIHKAEFTTASEGEMLSLLKAAPRPLSESGKGGKTRVSELVMFSKNTPLDTSYGEPDIIKAYDDYMIARSVRKYQQSYFDNATTPRIMILVEGDTTFSQALVNQIEKFLESRGGIDALQQSLILQVPNDCRLRIEPMKMAHLTEGDSLVGLRGDAESYVKLAHRTPDAVLPGAEGSDATSTRTFMTSVVRPAQQEIENKFNWIFKQELGISDWVLHLQIPDIADEKSMYEIWDIGLRRGILTVNEVRAKLSLPPVDGADQPWVLVPGAGVVLVSKIEEMANRVAQGAKYGDVMSTVDMKTPAKGVQPLGVNQTSLGAMTNEKNKALALLVQPDAPLPQMKPEEELMMKALLEKIVINVDDIDKVFSHDDE